MRVVRYYHFLNMESIVSITIGIKKNARFMKTGPIGAGQTREARNITNSGLNSVTY